MKKALVIHPVMSFLAGAEFLCLCVCKALQEADFQVTLATNVFDPSEAERMYGMGDVMKNCLHVRIPEFRPIAPRMLALQRLLYAVRAWFLLAKTESEVVFSTQSSPFIIPQKKACHFLYSILDLFSYPPGSSPGILLGEMKPLGKLYYSFVKTCRRILWEKRFQQPIWFFALGSAVLRDLRTRGFGNSSLIFPPFRGTFVPKVPKRKQVVQIARLIPEKRLEIFFEIAEKLPQYPFYVLGREPPIQRKLFHTYREGLLSKIPRNVTYVEGVTRDHRELLQDSAVYLYTGTEPGIGVAPIEAIAAGCIPLSPHGVGNADIIEAANVGLLYDTVEEAADKIRRILESKYSESDIRNITRKAELFSEKAFSDQVKRLVR
jgi:glycosyltransferase involved in cell wall biosynthesis